MKLAKGVGAAHSPSCQCQVGMHDGEAARVRKTPRSGSKRAQGPLAEGFSEGVEGAAAQGEGPGGGGGIAGAAKKVGGPLLRRSFRPLLAGRGWLTSAAERRKAMELIGQKHGLIRCERLDRLALQSGSTRSGSLRSSPSDGLRHSPERQHAALQWLERLLHHSGGIQLRPRHQGQLALASRSAGARASVQQTLRFSATPWAFAFLREGIRPTCWSPTTPPTAIPISGAGSPQLDPRRRHQSAHLALWLWRGDQGRSALRSAQGAAEPLPGHARCP